MDVKQAEAAKDQLFKGRNYSERVNVDLHRTILVDLLDDAANRMKNESLPLAAAIASLLATLTNKGILTQEEGLQITETAQQLVQEGNEDGGQQNSSS